MACKGRKDPIVKQHRFVSVFSIVSLAVVMAAGQPAASVRATAAPSSLIVPGVAIGPVALGPSAGAASIIAALGKGAAFDKRQDQVTQTAGTGNLKGIWKVRLYSGQVVDIETTSAAVATKSGIHVGSPAKDVKTAYGSALQTNGSSLFLVGTTQIKDSVGNHVHTYFDLDKTNTKVESIRTGYFPWLTPCFDGPTNKTSGGDITKSEKWTTRGCPYLFDYGDFSVVDTAVTVDPGVIVRLADTDGLASLVVSGKLIAHGTADQPIIFTSENDQARGAIAPFTGKAPHASDWGALALHRQGLDQLNHAIVAYGGGSEAGHSAALFIAEKAVSPASR